MCGSGSRSSSALRMSKSRPSLQPRQPEQDLTGNRLFIIANYCQARDLLLPVYLLWVIAPLVAWIVDLDAWYKNTRQRARFLA